MELYTVDVRVAHPKTGEMIKQGVGIKVQANGVDQAKKRILAKMHEKGLPPVRSINLTTRLKNHFVAYCAPVAQTKPTPGVDMRWKKPPG